MIRAGWRDKVDTFWAGELGCAAGNVQGLTFCSDQSAANRIFVLAQDSGAVISLSPRLHPLVRSVARRATIANIIDPDFWNQELPEIESIRGPAFLAYADAGEFRPIEHHSTVLLEPADEMELQRFRTSLGEEAWEHSGLGDSPECAAGLFEDGSLVAVAGYRVWGEVLAHIVVGVRPSARGKGLGRAVVSWIGREALKRGLVLQYRTLLANQPSVSIARRLGFVHYADTLAIRVATVGSA